MVKHIVLFDFCDDVDVASIMQKLSDLQGLIPEVRSFIWGVNIAAKERTKGLGTGFEMTFDSLEALQVYSKHPAHQKVLHEALLPACREGAKSVLAFDYEY